VSLDERVLADLIEMDRRDVLSLTLDVDPTKPENQHGRPAYKVWLGSALHDLLEGLTAEDRKAAREPVERIVAHVERALLESRGLAIFAAPGLWQEFALPVSLPSRIRYGRPDVIPVLWALDEHEPYAILAVFRDRAAVLIVRLGRASVIQEETFELDTSDWRFKAGRQPTFTKQSGGGASRGAAPDAHAARVEEQVRRFWRRAAEEAASLLRDQGIGRLIIAGPEEAAHAVRELLPEFARKTVVSLVPVRSSAGPDEIRERTLPVALAEERRREAELVAQILNDAARGAGAVVGPADTIAALRRGQVQTVVADRDVNAEVWYCANCGFTSKTEVRRCPVCGAPVARVRLAEILPLLARRTGARLELADGPAAAALRPHDGIGGVLRYA
jgi:rubrerythrin